MSWFIFYFLSNSKDDADEKQIMNVGSTDKCTQTTDYECRRHR